MTDTEKMRAITEMSRGLIRGSIVEDAICRFMAQVLQEAHASRVAPYCIALRAIIAEPDRAVELAREAIGE